MHFIRTKEHNNVALSALVSYAHMKSGDVRAVDSQGQSHLIAADEFDRALETVFQAIIPAEPGTYFLTSVLHENGDNTWDRDPVIAWGIGPLGGTSPIGTDGVDDGNRAILLPSGQVTHPSGSWDSVEAYEARWAEGRP